MPLWFEESDKQVWHRMMRRAAPLDYHAACGWHQSPIIGRVWFQKDQEAGPPEPERCRTCIGQDGLAMPDSRGGPHRRDGRCCRGTPGHGPFSRLA